MIPSQSEFRLLKLTLPTIHESVRHNLGLRNYRDLARHLLELTTFDMRFGVSTNGVIPAAELEFDDLCAQARAVRYRAAPPFGIRTGIAALAPHLGSFEDVTFVDYGCGAGRVMVIAAELGFGHVVGLELSPGLITRCRANLDRYGAQYRSTTRFEVLKRNAMEYRPDDSARVFFFFNPFDQQILDGVIKQIEASLDDAPRTVYILTFQARRYDFSKTRFTKIREETAVQVYSNR